MTTASILVLIFVVAPGFLADTLLRAIHVEKRLTDFERTVRSIILSGIGLLTYLAFFQLVEFLLHTLGGRPLAEWVLAPPYLPALGDPTSETAVALDEKLLLTFLLHALFTCCIAIAWAVIINSLHFEAVVRKWTGRGTGGVPWQMFWSRYYPVGGERPQRSVTVQMAGGTRVMGFLQSASTIDDKDIVLGHPWVWDSKRDDWHAQNARFMYIPARMIEYISLSPSEPESAASGWLKEMKTQDTQNRRSEDE